MVKIQLVDMGIVLHPRGVNRVPDVDGTGTAPGRMTHVLLPFMRNQIFVCITLPCN